MTSNTVVVDANVLYSIEVTDLLLTIAAERIIRVHWSNEILDEVRRNLRERLSADAVEYRIGQMNRAFPSALDDPPVGLVDEMQVNRKDRHVLALAVHLDIGVIVTENMRDFPRRLCEPHGVEAITPDEFLARHVHDDPQLLWHAVETMAARRRRPPRTAEAILDRLAARYPTFVAALRSTTSTLTQEPT